ncbi:MAG: hypothetical protein GX303_08480 [Clostridiales bacterium]|nr:hypothetical protein [Clostridiales bacterium]
MVEILSLQKQFILNHLSAGDIAVDFTMGNGHDTEFLSRTVGENGRVYAFDIQSAALESTRARLTASGCPNNYILIQDSHHHADRYIKTKIKAGMFNLGYLPGGDKRITTLRQTTLPAVDFAISALEDTGIIIVTVYPGHAEGAAEGELLTERLSKLDRKSLCVSKFQILNSPSSPYFIIIEK